MKILKYLFLFTCLLGLNSLQGQDFHNSYYQFAPLNINPALTGAFYGNLRASAIGSDQGSPVAGRGNHFQDLSIAIDGSVNFGLTEGDWVSGGINMARSMTGAGVAGLQRQYTGLALAYHLAFGKKGSSVFTIGAKYGNYNLGFRDNHVPGGENPYISPNTLLTGDPTDLDIVNFLGNNISQNPDQPINKSSSDYMIGLLLDAPMGKTADIRLGIAADHIFNPRLTNQGGASAVSQDRRINAFVSLYTDINNNLTFNPNILYQTSGVSTNLLLQGLFKLQFREKKNLALEAGLGLRLVNSMDIPLYLGVNINDLKIGIAYDTNVAGLRPSNNTFGAVELGISKIFSWNKKAEVKPVFICPRL